MSIDAIVVEDDKLGGGHRQARRGETALKQLIDEGSLGRVQPDDEAQPAATDAAASEVDDAPVVKYIQKILLDAISDGASDIHFEPYERSTASATASTAS